MCPKLNNMDGRVEIWTQISYTWKALHHYAIVVFPMFSQKQPMQARINQSLPVPATFSSLSLSWKWIKLHSTFCPTGLIRHWQAYMPHFKPYECHIVKCGWLDSVEHATPYCRNCSLDHFHHSCLGIEVSCSVSSFAFILPSSCRWWVELRYKHVVPVLRTPPEIASEWLSLLQKAITSFSHTVSCLKPSLVPDCQASQQSLDKGQW